MPRIEHEVIRTYKLILSEQEAEFLRDYLQNDIFDKESDSDRGMRHAIFTKLKSKIEESWR